MDALIYQYTAVSYTLIMKEVLKVYLPIATFAMEKSWKLELNSFIQACRQQLRVLNGLIRQSTPGKTKWVHNFIYVYMLN